MPSCAINGPGHMPRPERRSHGCHSGCAERRLKAGSRPRRERDSVRLEPVIDVADPSAITSTLDLQDSRSCDVPGSLVPERLTAGKRFAVLVCKMREAQCGSLLTASAHQ